VGRRPAAGRGRARGRHAGRDDGRDLFGNPDEGVTQLPAGCHNIRTEQPPVGTAMPSPMTGPDLTHLMSRKEFAGAIFDLYLREDPDDRNSPHTTTVNTRAAARLDSRTRPP
jgi:hypothetical protein